MILCDSVMPAATELPIPPVRRILINGPWRPAADRPSECITLQANSRGWQWGSVGSLEICPDLTRLEELRTSKESWRAPRHPSHFTDRDLKDTQCQCHLDDGRSGRSNIRQKNWKTWQTFNSTFQTHPSWDILERFRTSFEELLWPGDLWFHLLGS